MKKQIFSIILAIAVVLAMSYSCSEEFLEKTPTGSANQSVLANEKGVNALLVGAYAAIDGAGDVSWWGGSWAWAAAVSNWVWGSVWSDEAYKGTESGDQEPINYIEAYDIPTANSYPSDKWNANYDGISRANDVLKTMAIASDLTEEKKTLFKAQALFLRSWFHFELQRVFRNIPYIDETVDPDQVPNTGQVWDRIEEDMQFAIDNLPEEHSGSYDVGRPTKYAAMAVMARVHLFQQEWQAAADLLDDIIASDKYELMPNYFDNFLIAKRNNAESIFEIQYAVNDGTDDSFNGGYGDCLNYPQGGDIGTCCGFFQPSQWLVNHYKVDANGLPLFDHFSDTDLANDMGIASNQVFVQDTVTPVDPRLDFTVGRRGVPYLDWGIHRGMDWIRLMANGGPYLYKKNMFLKSESGTYQTTKGWATGVNANNYRAYRYSHVLLWRAECAVELNDLDYARELVNQIRDRADNQLLMGRCRTFVLPSGTQTPNVPGGSVVDFTKTAANYSIGQYPDNATWTQAYARQAVHHEIMLEFAMEGHRFFDLRRWGELDDVIPAFLEHDKGFRAFLGTMNAEWNAPKDEYAPIPLSQLDLQEGILTQDPNY